jgi:hypothetical protein
MRMDELRRPKLGATVLLLALLPAAGRLAAEQKDLQTYRWVDEKGVVHYGDRVPPQYASQERSILNRQGVETGRVEAQKTPEQLALEAVRNAELLKQQQHDYFLLTTYTSTNDIEQLRDLRLGQIRAQRAAAEQYVHGLHERLMSLQTRAMLFKPYSARPEARRMPDDLAEDLVRTLNEMQTQRSALKTKLQEEASLRSEFQTDIDRFKLLRSVRASR